jgi:hypothetical protein
MLSNSDIILIVLFIIVIIFYEIISRGLLSMKTFKINFFGKYKHIVIFMKIL